MAKQVKVKDVEQKAKPTDEEVRNFDISSLCGEWGMYSYDRPSYTLWAEVGRELFRNGWTLDEIRTLLQSKHPRWALDGTLGDKLREVARDWAKEVLPAHSEIKGWLKEETDYKAGKS